MKNSGKILICIVIIISIILPVSAETTFFEGEYFIYGSEPISGGSGRACTPIISCSDWSNCKNSIQSRVCTNLNECGLNNEEIIRSCSIIGDGFSRAREALSSGCINLNDLDLIINMWRSSLSLTIQELDESLNKFKNNRGC